MNFAHTHDRESHFRDRQSLLLGLVVCNVESDQDVSRCLVTDQPKSLCNLYGPLATHCEPSALYCWILEILYCNPKERVQGFAVDPDYWKGEVFAYVYVGLPQNLKDLKEHTHTEGHHPFTGAKIAY